MSDVIFKCAQKGTRATEAELCKLFPSCSPAERLEYILRHGERQVSTSERRDMAAQHRAQIVQYFCSRYVDSKTNLPLPAARIELALKETKVKVDYQLSMEKQLSLVKKAFLGLLPLKEVHPEEAQGPGPARVLPTGGGKRGCKGAGKVHKRRQK